jgi:hypothetical protein
MSTLTDYFDRAYVINLPERKRSAKGIATAWGGPADYIDETCGILVAPSNIQAIRPPREKKTVVKSRLP